MRMHCDEPKSQAESYCNREAQAPGHGNVTKQKCERDDSDDLMWSVAFKGVTSAAHPVDARKAEKYK